MENEQSEYLSYENLQVWEKAVQYSVDTIEIIDTINSGRRNFRLIEQIESSATSVAMNIAEGKGRWSKKEFAHFLYISRGSLYENLTLLEILNRLKWIEQDKVKELRIKGMEINKMLNSLIQSVKSS
jgi:four helix bundle protein